MPLVPDSQLGPGVAIRVRWATGKPFLVKLQVVNGEGLGLHRRATKAKTRREMKKTTEKTSRGLILCGLILTWGAGAFPRFCNFVNMLNVNRR